MNKDIEELSKNLQILVNQVKKVHEDMFLHSVKDKTYRKYTMQIRGIMNTLDKVLETLPNLKELDTNMYLCYENDIYLSCIKGRYIISSIKDDKVKVLGFSWKLQKALEIFYSKAYNTNKKQIKEYIDDDNNNFDN